MMTPLFHLMSMSIYDIYKFSINIFSGETFCPLESVWALVNPSNMWANLQQADQPQRLRYRDLQQADQPLRLRYRDLQQAGQP
jgi:hypothetical protein